MDSISLDCSLTLSGGIFLLIITFPSLLEKTQGLSAMLMVSLRYGAPWWKKLMLRPLGDILSLKESSREKTI